MRWELETRIEDWDRNRRVGAVFKILMMQNLKKKNVSPLLV